ncbi:NADP-dependent malic enzyme [Chlorella sorokiniana]|uniref:NADP-dependent malic enzyme n=1 Tax=Chlorella sorokiniana TaxID=3076 RepID=A0A2P6TPZ2_CHLSO|nr:NADP-dependent malic enzyme [Chlorella sorokiniana]|eukprot:PRW56101.1 NADP-dependent malic enzyme [Chlorella sorokiniana]
MALAALGRALQRGAASEVAWAACGSRALAAGLPSAAALGGARWLSGVPVHEDEEDHSRPTTPWVRSVISGVDLMRDARYNKGLAFSQLERDRLYLRGLLPPAVLSQEVQAERVMTNIRSKLNGVDQHTYLMSLQERNERLFYYCLMNHIEELLPIMKQPVTAEYCKGYSLMFRSLPRAMYLSLEDKGSVFSILKNWPERRIKAICLTDGQSVGHLGDLGVQAIGVPIARLALYTACGGIVPSACLPVTIDAGTDNEALLQDPIYVGGTHRRVRGDAYWELMDEFLSAVRRRYGSSVLIDFASMDYGTQSKLIGAYRGMFPMYSDAAFGLPTAVMAAIYAALPPGESLLGQRFMLVGESPRLTAIAELLEEAVQREDGRGTVLEARKIIHLVDSKGLVVRDRADAEHLEDHKLPYAQDRAPCDSLLEAVRQIKPTVLIGLSDDAPPHAFDREVCEALAAGCERPLILPLSRKSPDGRLEASEVSPADALAWTQGRALFADKVTSGSVALPGGGVRQLRKVDTTYVFPGLALGVMMSRSTRVREDMLLEAAKAVARRVPEEDRAAGALMPPTAALRDIAAHVAAAVANKAYNVGVATELPRPHDLLGQAHSWMHNPRYRRYR